MLGSDHADAGAGQLGHGTKTHDWQQGPGYFGGWDPLAYDLDGLENVDEMDLEAWLMRYGARHVGGGPVAELVEMDCLLCHTSIDNSARETALGKGDFSWANSAPLGTLNALTHENNQWRWNAAVFQPDGSLTAGLLDIRKPQDKPALMSP
jgi:hypothetical protein